MESYLQAVGRVERDGSDVLSILFYCAYHLCHCDPTMRAFVKNKVKCRHVETVFETVFNEKIKNLPYCTRAAVCVVNSVIVEPAQKKC